MTLRAARKEKKKGKRKRKKQRKKKMEKKEIYKVRSTHSPTPALENKNKKLFDLGNFKM